MALRKLLRETNLPSKALFFFPEDNMTGIAPTKIILQKNNVYLDFPSLICLNEINGHQIYPKLELSLFGIPANRAHPKQDSTNSNNRLNNTI